MELLIAILIIALVVVLAFWIVDQIPIPNPFNWIVKAIVGIIALVILLQRAAFI